MTSSTDTRMTAPQITLIGSAIGKSLDCIFCDEFLFRPSSYQVVWIQVDGQVYALENLLETHDYFGAIEDIAVLSLRKAHDKEISSRLANTNIVRVDVKRNIVDVLVVQDHEWAADEKGDLHTYDYTKALVFVFDDSQLILEKAPCLFEDIEVRRCPDATSTLSPAGDESDLAVGWTGGASREVLSVSELVGGGGALG